MSEKASDLIKKIDEVDDMNEDWGRFKSGVRAGLEAAGHDSTKIGRGPIRINFRQGTSVDDTVKNIVADYYKGGQS